MQLLTTRKNNDDGTSVGSFRCPNITNARLGDMMVKLGDDDEPSNKKCKGKNLIFFKVQTNTVDAFP